MVVQVSFKGWLSDQAPEQFELLPGLFAVFRER
jgi:hypothetical protein